MALAPRAEQPAHLIQEAAAEVRVAVPETAMRRSVLMYGRIWDGSIPTAYAHGFPIRWRESTPVVASRLG